MKMIGMCIFPFPSSSWKSNPLSPGNRMSSTRQLGTSGSLLRSNSDPEPKSADCRPTDRNRLASALRIEASSSTTKTMGVDFGSSFIDRRGWGPPRSRSESIREASQPVSGQAPPTLAGAVGHPPASDDRARDARAYLVPLHSDYDSLNVWG